MLDFEPIHDPAFVDHPHRKRAGDEIRTRDVRLGKMRITNASHTTQAVAAKHFLIVTIGLRIKRELTVIDSLSLSE